MGIPLGYKANVNLVTKLSLEHEAAEGKYYIKEQNDLYQTDEFAKFVWFGIWRVVMLWEPLSRMWRKRCRLAMCRSLVTAGLIRDLMSGSKNDGRTGCLMDEVERDDAVHVEAH